MTYREEIEAMLRKMPPDWNRQYRSGRAKLGVALPDVPTPEQAMMLIGITAGGNESGDRPTGKNKVPKGVKDAAMKGLRLSYANNYGAWDFIGIARAIELALMSGVSDRTAQRMRNYFVRHQKDKTSRNFGNDASPSRGYMAWLNWGGDPGQGWTMRKNGFFGELFGRGRDVSDDVIDFYKFSFMQSHDDVAAAERNIARNGGHFVGPVVMDGENVRWSRESSARLLAAMSERADREYGHRHANPRRYSVVQTTFDYPELDVVKATYSSLKEAKAAVTLGPKHETRPWKRHGNEYEWQGSYNIWIKPERSNPGTPHMLYRFNPAYTIVTDKNLFRIFSDGQDTGKYATSEVKARAIIEKLTAADAKPPAGEKKPKKYKRPLLSERVSPIRGYTDADTGYRRPVRLGITEPSPMDVKKKRGKFRFLGGAPTRRPVWGSPYRNERVTRDGQHLVVAIEPLGPRTGAGPRYSAVFVGGSEDAVYPQREPSGFIYLVQEGPEGSPVIMARDTTGGRITPESVLESEFTEEIVNIGVKVGEKYGIPTERIDPDIGEYFK